MANRRAIARVGGRVVAGVVAIVVAGATIAAATLLPLSGHSITPPAATVAPVPAAQQRVCPGPLLGLAADASATSTSAFDSPSIVASASSHLTTRSLKAPDDVQNNADATPQLLTVHVPHGASSTPLIGGAQSQTATQDDLTGLATAVCGEASDDGWLVAGATTLGESSLVMLSNPSTVQATVDLTLYGESGVIDAPGARGIIVEPGSQSVVPLAGIAPNVKAPVVHVVATGGRIYANLQQSLVQGIEPQGVELAGPTLAAAESQVIPGVTVRNSDAIQGAGGAETASTLVPSVRILAPGQKSAKVTLKAIPATNATPGATTTVTLQGGTAQEVAFPRLVDGRYTFTIDSDVPVVASARTTDYGSKTKDFAWFSASAPLADRTLIAVAPGGSSTLNIANPGGAAATVNVSGAGAGAGAGAGSAGSDVTVKAGSSASVSVEGGQSYTLSGAKGLYASIATVGDGAISSYAINPPGPLAQPIVVYPR